MIVKNTDKNTVVCNGCSLADSFFSRFMGLMGKQALVAGSGLLISPCNSIHMFFMRFPIDAIFLNRENQVVHIIEGIRPWHLSPLISKACSVLELPPGTVGSTSTEVGDRLEIVKSS